MRVLNLKIFKSIVQPHVAVVSPYFCRSNSLISTTCWHYLFVCFNFATHQRTQLQTSSSFSNIWLILSLHFISCLSITLQIGTFSYRVLISSIQKGKGKGRKICFTYNPDHESLQSFFFKILYVAYFYTARRLISGS